MGKSFEVSAQGLTVGRAQENDVVIDDQEVSRQHAHVAMSEGRFYLADLGSGNGTLLNGERLRSESRWLNSGDSIDVGEQTLRFVAGQRTQIGRVSQIPERDTQAVALTGTSLSVGRDPSNDLALDDPNVSRFHAEIRRAGEYVELRDLGSRNGTRLDREFIKGRANLVPGSEIGIGPFRLVYDGTKFIRRDDRGALRLRGDEISMKIGDKTILNRASIQIEPGEFVVVIGESGSGKTTMVKALAGVTSPTSGRVLVSGEPVMSRLTDIGYVPQDEIVHRGLTVLEGLRFAAALRLPGDSTEADIEAAVRRVLGELSLEQHANTRIGSLSGGQRKRVGVGTELLNRPSLLFLDEPTTGLDPGLETRLMELFSALSEEGSRAVTAVTHATKNLDLPDKVCVMGQGGELCYFGPPDEAKTFFGVNTYDGIYTALDTRPAVEWRQEFEAEQARRAVKADPDAAPERVAPALRISRPQPNVGRQTALLSHRYLKLFLRDRRNLFILLGQAPLIALGIALLFDANILNPATGDPNNGALLIFLVVTTMIWLGSIDAAREIIKERAVMERERAVGVRLSAYLASKAIVLFTLVATQAFLLAAVVFSLRGLTEPLQAYALLYAVLVTTGAVAVAMGLLISAVVSSEDQAASFIPLALIPQLLFGGAIVTVNEMGGTIAGFSNVIFSRWAFAGSGSAADIPGRLEGTRPLAAAAAGRYGNSFFDISVIGSLLILAAFVAIFMGATYMILANQRSRN
jgi:ABC-type multidrug transport system ATPase subunit/pSer/pThr/pTyr-binding forkhead associated (FHA) protein